MKLSKNKIVNAVHEAECPMLDGMNIDNMSKAKIVKKLTEACCPVLEELGEKKTPA